MSDARLHATIARGEAVLTFPYDDRLRVLLRCIPGRRWDPVTRAWCIPLAGEQAAALDRLLFALGEAAEVQDELARALHRLCRRRSRSECVAELVRPDQDWWLGFATDGEPGAVRALLAHPGARTLETIGRAVVPLDARTGEISRALVESGALHPSAGARRALAALGATPSERTAVPSPAAPERTAPWRGTVDAGGAPGAPVFLLLADPERPPEELRARARPAPGGAAIPMDADSLPGVRRLGGWMTEAARRCAAAIAAGRPAPPATLEISAAHHPLAFALAPGHDPGAPERFAALPGVMAPSARGGRLAAIRADPFCVPDLDRFIAQEGVWVEPGALEVLQELREQHAHGAGLVELSSAHEAELEVAGLGGELKPFQRAGVAYLLQQRRALLADEQGLGKTIEALATLEADGAYPAVIVCPAALKLNWLRELQRWLGHRSARALAGTRGRGPSRATDVTVLSYDVAHARLGELEALRPRALVLDESHYCKSAKAKRTQAVTRLAGCVEPSGLVLGLTGTPVVNRPAELIPQLRILGRLADFGNGAEFGERFQGPDAHMRLHWHLRARCMVRRLKADVLPQLPAKTRSVVPIALDNEPEYRLAERDLVAWLQSQPLDLRELDAKVASAMRAERLVRLGALKLLAARGKLRAALRWIHDFRASGERLVVFAHHREIQHALLAHFPSALHILGSDTPIGRERALHDFQEAEGDAHGLIVCSIEVAGQGLTLTRSSNVAFLELDWTPARHDQAEDRCHRIGQRDAVNAYYLLAADTIDESIATLLERKRAVIAAVTDGREEDEAGVVEALVRELRGTPYRHLRAVA